MAYTTIDDPTAYFNTLLYTGNATDDRSISGVGFQPDFVWLKRRDTTGSHRLIDVIRGATKTLIPNGDGAEGTEADVIQAFESDGIQIGADSASNANSGTFVLWNWLAGGSASSNSNGSITSSVSASTTSGFSIVSYSGNGTSGATVGHGLGVVPKMIIVKRRDSTRNWTVYHQGTGNTHGLTLNTTDAKVDSDSYWNDTTPSSTVFTLGNGSNVNNGSGTYIAYCFSQVKGYSKFGIYTGNGNADGTFVYTGFKPAFILLKDSTGSGNNWFIWDNKRDGYNVSNKYLRPNLNNAEGYYEAIDILSNGFKNRNTSGSANGSQTYIYMAFAESPFVSSGGIPTNAK